MYKHYQTRTRTGGWFSGQKLFTFWPEHLSGKSLVLIYRPERQCIQLAWCVNYHLLLKLAVIVLNY